MKNEYLPWVEKYRPNNLEDIVLSKYNKITLVNKNIYLICYCMDHQVQVKQPP